MGEFENIQYQEACKRADESKKEAEKNVEEMKNLCNLASDLSLKNYSDWRDYLHRYYLVMLAIAGGLGIYQKTNQLSLILIISGVLLGFILINLYLYWERKHIRFSYDIDITKPYKLFDYPGIKNNPSLALKLNLEKIIKDNTDLLKKSDNKEQSKLLRGKIKADKRWLGMIKYWNMYGFERIWIIGVVISLLLTFVGIVLIFFK
ncbi:MAG: hypothetical protein PHT84_02030 [Candidatus Pacebacteria bacterium]|nr:hypothetical protein [Candidatus Paceibacterota bacterium]